MASTLKIVFAVTGIFVAGAVTGGFVSLRVAERLARAKRAQVYFAPNELGDRLAAQLRLTPEQQNQVRPIIRRMSDELRDMRRDSFKQTAAIINRMDADLSQVLTEEQRVLLKELREREDERRKKWMAERGRRREPSPGEPGLPPPPPPEGEP